MLDKLFNKYKKSDNSAITNEDMQAAIVGRKMQQRINEVKPKIEMTTILIDRNRWSLTTIVLSLITLVSVIGWYIADERFSNHVKVAFVKLSPSGSFNVSYYDENSKPTYFINTINSLLSNYVERRFSKESYSISSDYGYALNFMSPELKNSFINDYKAAQVAAEFSACKNCQQIQVRVRTTPQNEESDSAIIDGKPGTVYHTTVFARVTELNPDGTESSKINEIISLTWTIQDITSLPDNLDAIEANPVGIVILAESVKVDPTPAQN